LQGCAAVQVLLMTKPRLIFVCRVKLCFIQVRMSHVLRQQSVFTG
jgi:hypothetical protein